MRGKARNAKSGWWVRAPLVQSLPVGLKFCNKYITIKIKRLSWLLPHTIPSPLTHIAGGGQRDLGTLFAP